MQDDDSGDWAEMRSWLVWCLRDKLGDSDVLTAAAAARHSRSSSPLRSSSVSCRGGSAAPRAQLVRQQAVHERSPRIGVVDCSGPTPPGSSPLAPGGGGGGRTHLLRCRSAETGRVHQHYVDASLDAGSGTGDSAASVVGRLAVDASCSGQSSFESYGSTG